MPCESPGPEGRLSRPTAMVGARPTRSQATVAKARPSPRANSGVSSASTRPRTSYCRKTDLGTFMILSRGRRGSLAGERQGRLRQGAGTLAGHLEEITGPEAQDDDG